MMIPNNISYLKFFTLYLKISLKTLLERIQQKPKEMQCSHILNNDQNLYFKSNGWAASIPTLITSVIKYGAIMLS